MMANIHDPALTLSGTGSLCAIGQTSVLIPAGAPSLPKTVPLLVPGSPASIPTRPAKATVVSPARLRRETDGSCAERFIRTLKENLLWIRTFATVDELRLPLPTFRHIYDTTWLIQRLNYQTPAQVRQPQSKLGLTVPPGVRSVAMTAADSLCGVLLYGSVSTVINPISLEILA